jgi:hypothetical protein
MAGKLLNIVAFATLAILASTYGPTQATALSVEARHGVARHVSPKHEFLAKRQAGQTNPKRRRCKAGSSSSPSSQASSSAAPPSGNSPQQPATTSTTNAPATTPTPSPANNPPATGGGGKAGIAWNNQNPYELTQFMKGKVSAVYTWSPWKPESMNGRNDIEFIPMVHSSGQIAQARSLLTPGYARTVLGFNEPDQQGQANIDPYTAVQLWKDNIQPLASQGYRLISPAPTNAPSGTTWLVNFINACDGCTIDAVAAHWYGTSLDQFTAHITNYHNTFNRPVWVTEFACQNFGGGEQCTVDQIWAVLKGACDFMDNASWVEKYFWFGALRDMGNVNVENRLLSSGGQITPLGTQYIS